MVDKFLFLFCIKLYELYFLCSYLKKRATSLTRTPLSILLKAVSSLSDEMLSEVQSVCWEILYEGNKCVVEAAGE